MSLKSLIGSAIKTRRKELQMQQVDLQDYAEIGSTALSNLEQGKANISIDKLEKIFEVLGLELVVKVKG
jgi:transcriptional regulator with XRE-family HTH domain